MFVFKSDTVALLKHHLMPLQKNYIKHIIPYYISCEVYSIITNTLNIYRFILKVSDKIRVAAHRQILEFGTNLRRGQKNKQTAEKLFCFVFFLSVQPILF